MPIRGDREHYRQLWCEVCKRWRDRDLVAVLNISRRGWLRFDRSSKEGEAGEAVRGNLGHYGEPVILRVDASKSRDALHPAIEPYLRWNALGRTGPKRGLARRVIYRAPGYEPYAHEVRHSRADQGADK